MERDHQLRIAEWALGEKRIFLPNLNEKGVALIMVLWIIAILSVIAFEFSYAMRTEVKIVKNFQEELQLYALAEGGVERAIAELVYKHDPRVQNKSGQVYRLALVIYFIKAFRKKPSLGISIRSQGVWAFVNFF